MTFKKMQSAGYLANHTARLFAAGLQKRIAPLGLAPAQFMTLLELWNEAPLTQKELTKRLAVEQATMANTIARMQRDDLITRTPHPEDKRASNIFLTQKAIDIRQQATQAARLQNEQALKNISPEDHENYLKTMRQIIANLSGAT